jgi:hypothetical protein
LLTDGHHGSDATRARQFSYFLFKSMRGDYKIR